MKQERLERIRQNAINAKQSRIKVIELNQVKRPQVKRSLKATQEQKDEIVQLQNSAQIQVFKQFVSHAENVLDEYSSIMQNSDTISNQRCAELEVYNKDLHNRCAGHRNCLYRNCAYINYFGFKTN